MQDQVPAQLSQQYNQLRAQYDARQISQEQFLAEARKLQVQDASGVYWAVDAGSGAMLRYDGSQWMTAQTPTSTPTPSPQSPGSTAKPNTRNLARYTILLVPLISAFIWFAYSSLSPSSEGWDCLTPLIIAGVPAALLVFDKQLSALLQPIQPIRKIPPRIMLIGAAVALPFVLGLICSSTSSSGYGAIRASMLFSMLGAYALLHETEVKS